MLWRVLCVVLLCAVCGSSGDGTSRESLQPYAPEHGSYFDHQDWRAVTTIPEMSSIADTQDHWTGAGDSGVTGANAGNGEMKRLRRRKNKKRRRKPQRPYLPDIETGDAGAASEQTADHKAYRRPFSQARQRQNGVQADEEGIADIKNLLKQSGGLSLSEVLQQKNLSLADLLTGKQQAISALKMTDQIKLISEDTETEIIDIDENGEHIRTRIPGHNKATKQHITKQTMTTPDRKYAISTIHISETDLSDHLEQDDTEEAVTEKPKRPSRLPPVRRPAQTIRKNYMESNAQPINERIPQRRKLPPVSISRRNNNFHLQNQMHEATTEEKFDIPTIMHEPENHKDIISNQSVTKETEEPEKVETTEPTDVYETMMEEEEPEENMDVEISTMTSTTSTTTSSTTTTPKITTLNPRNRLNLKPRLRLPPPKNKSQKITNIEPTPKVIPNNISDVEIVPPPKANPTDVKESVVSGNELEDESSNEITIETTTTEAPSSTTTARSTSTTTVRTTTARNVLRRKTTQAPSIKSADTVYTAEKKKIKEPNAKDEILEVLNDYRGGERLARILADRNMSLGELVEQRERGSSQLHLADIFHNSSREPNVGEPFLSKSMLEPISKEIYPLKALLEGNLRQSNTKTKEQHNNSLQNMQQPLKDNDMATQINDLGILTLFETLSEIGIHPKDIKASDIKKDSEGSSYFTSVISVKPTNEIYKESRNNIGFKSSNKQISEIYSSLPTYINSEEIINAKVVPDWSMKQGENIADNKIERDLDGDGLIVLGDLQPIDDDNVYPGASRSKFNKGDQGATDTPGGVRSAIIVSAAIVGTSIVVFLTILVGCRVRQTKRRKRVLEDGSGGGIETVGGRKLSLHTSRSASPILPHPFSSPLSSHHYQWDTLKKPFQ